MNYTLFHKWLRIKMPLPTYEENKGGKNVW